MKSSRDLQAILRRIDSRGYKAYKDIKGTYDFQSYQLRIDHVQGDPFATPSRVRVWFEHDYPAYTYKNKSREIAFRDFLTRQFAQAIRRHARGNRGTGKSGLIGIDTPGQEVLERTSVVLDPERVEVRFIIGLPAFGRRIAGRNAIEMFMNELPRIVEASIFFSAIDEKALKEHLETCEDAAERHRDEL